MEPSSKGYLFSFALHAAVLAAIALGGAIGGCRYRKKPPEIVDFTIAVDPSGVEEEAPPEPPKEQVKPPPAPPKPDDIVQPKPKPKSKPEKKPEPKKEPPKKEPPKKPEIKKGKRVTHNVDSPVKPKERQTLSDAEIDKFLAGKARIGETTSIPKNQLSMDVSMLTDVLYEAWTPPPRSASGYRPATIVFGVARDGTLTSPRVEVSSGSEAYDASCVEAVRRAGRVQGLSSAFIREYGAGCPFVFKQKD